MKRTLAALTLCSMLLFAVSAAAVEKVYFGDTGHNKIRRCDLNGFNIEELVTTGLDAVGSIAIDRTGGKMYWADWPEATAHIKRADLDGTNVETIHAGLSGPYGVALDVPSGKLYWTEFSAGVVRRSNLDGTNIDDLITIGLNHPNGIALDLDNGKMYITQGALTGKILRSNLDGSGIEWLITTRLSAPMEIALDLEGGKMYWCDLGTDSLYRANLNGSNVEALLASEFGTPVGIDLDLAASKIYYSDSGAGGAKIKRANLDGTNVQDVISSGIGSCYGLTLGPAEAECSDASLDGPWLVRVIGAEPYDYTVYMVYDGQGTIDDMGAFGTPDSAGEYSVDANCDITGFIWADGYAPFTGQLDSDSTGQMTVNGLGPLDMIKVMDVGALEGCWTGTFVQDTTLTTYNVTIQIDGTGTVTSTAGFLNPMGGHFYYQPPYVAGFMKTGSAPAASPWDEIMIHDAMLAPNGYAMSGTFAIDCTDCPRGTFYLALCDAIGVEDRSPAPSSALHPNYPNPFNPQTTIEYTLRDASRVHLRIYDPAGRLVRTLLNEDKPAGTYTTIWNGRDDSGAEASSGVYFVRFETGNDVHARKIVFLK